MIRFNAARFEASKARVKSRLEGELRKRMVKLEGHLREVAGEIATEAALITFPKSAGDDIRFVRAAIIADIRRIFPTASEAFGILERSNPAIARAFYVAWKRGDLRSARNILRGSGTILSSVSFGPPSRSLHESARSGPRRRVRGLPLRICSDQARADFVSETIRRIGRAAAGWSAAAEQIGAGASIPDLKSTRRHGRAGGDMLILRSATGVRYVIRNSVDYIAQNITAAEVQRLTQLGRARLRERMGR